jgi:hypothetical protein
VPVTDEQADVVNAPVESRRVVIAGPGTGKTHTLVARASTLTAAGRRTLAISFSRSATAEMRRRSAALPDHQIGIVTTMDALATRIIIDNGSDPKHAGYDQRIRMATTIVNSSRRVEALDDVEHLLFDEGQDLLGTRAELAVALIARGDRGFTIFGDPAQSIYGFQSHESLPNALQLVDARFPNVTRTELIVNHRSTDPEAAVALWAGSELNTPGADYVNIRRRLVNNCLETPSLGHLDRAAGILSGPASRTAIICRTNGAVLSTSLTLAAMGIEHVIRSRAADRRIARWIAAAILAVGSEIAGTTLHRDALDPVLANLADTTDTDADEMWLLLRRLGGTGPRSVDVADLRSRLSSGYFPDELISAPVPALTATTVHRAKGLEFDRALIDAALWRSAPAEGDLPEETRVLYVALTRARSELMSIEVPKTEYLRKFGGPAQRWGCHGFIEALASDVAADRPFFTGDSSAKGVQNTLRGLSAGTPVSLRLTSRGTTEYRVICNGSEIGMTTEVFAEGLRDVGVRSPNDAPPEIVDLHIEDVVTTVGLPAASSRAGLGPFGIWLSPVIGGLGRFTMK